MNKTYLIVPAVLLGGFFWFQQEAEQGRRLREQNHKARLAATKQERDRERDLLLEQTAAETGARAAEIAQKERALAARKQQDLEETLARLTREADRAAATVAELESATAGLDARLAQARDRRTRLEGEVFAEARSVEEHRVARRNAELDVQRAAQALAWRWEKRE